MTSPWVSKEDINLLTFLLIIDTFLRSKQYLKSVLKQTYWDYYDIIWSRMHGSISQLLTMKPKKRSFTRRRLQDCAPCSWIEGEKCRKVLKLSSLDIWSHGQYELNYGLFCTPTFNVIVKKSSYFIRHLKKSKLSKTKRAFWGRGGWHSPSPSPSPSPSQPMGASALYTSAG